MSPPNELIEIKELYGKEMYEINQELSRFSRDRSDFSLDNKVRSEPLLKNEETQDLKLPPQEKSSPVNTWKLTEADIKAKIEKFKAKKTCGQNLTEEEKSEFDRIRHVLANRESRQKKSKQKKQQKE